MKWMIASDLHGSAAWCQRLLACYEQQECQRLLLLGDLLYHGPRNDLPEAYAPKQVIEMLTRHQQEILCVRGNCDGEVDQMVLPFPILADYCLLPVEEHLVFATHGHHFHGDNLPPLKQGDVLLHGHTHVPKQEEVNGIWVLNPGSVSMPKEQSWHGVMTLEDGLFCWMDLESNEKMRLQL